MAKQQKKFDKRRFAKKQNLNRRSSDKFTDEALGNAKVFGGAINDIKWYRDNEQLLNDVSRLPYNIPVGLPVYNDGDIFPEPNSIFSVPGIIAMDVVPTYGKCDNAADPVNVAFNAMFAYIRSRVSGTNFTWDANTLAINLLATDAIYWTVKWYTRLYATLPLYHQSNKYLARALVEAQHVDFDDLLAHSAEFRAQLNMRIARINALKIPSELYVFARHQWLFENYYIEGASTKDQIYMYRPAAYYVHSYDANGIPYLETHRYLAGASGVGGTLTTDDLLRKLDAMLDPIFNDQYFNLISGFIEKAYEGHVMSIPYLPDQMVMPLIYSEEVLLQFKNAKTYPVQHAASGAGYLGNAFNLYQTPNSATDPRIRLQCLVGLASLRAYRSLNDDTITYISSSSTTGEFWNMYAVENEYSKSNLITSPRADVVPAENMINTRLIPAMHWITDSAGAPYGRMDYIDWGTEWPIECEAFVRYQDTSDNSINLFDFKFHTVMFLDASNPNAYNVTTTILPILSVFKFLPEMRIVCRTEPESDDATAVAPSKIPFFELDNYAVIKALDIGMMHQSAILSMLRVPEIASGPLSSR